MSSLMSHVLPEFSHTVVPASFLKMFLRHLVFFFHLIWFFGTVMVYNNLTLWAQKSSLKNYFSELVFVGSTSYVGNFQIPTTISPTVSKCLPVVGKKTKIFFLYIYVYVYIGTFLSILFFPQSGFCLLEVNWYLFLHRIAVFRIRMDPGFLRRSGSGF